jgi:hypothetical protein
MTCSVTTSITGLVVASASFTLPPPPAIPSLITQPPTPARRHQ